MVGPLIAGTAAAAAAGFMTWAVRGRSSPVFGRSIWRGPADRPCLALTFDDGPGDGTPALLDVLARHSVPATFFMCGAHVRRTPGIVRDIVAAGHEIGNHTDTHAPLWLQSRAFIAAELRRAQESIAEAAGVAPAWFRPTYGVRWFGLRPVQRDLRLTTVMWTTIGQDWRLPASSVAARLLNGARNGAILCLHDGRERNPAASIENTVQAVADVVPRLIGDGWQFATVSSLLGYSDAICRRTSLSE